MPLARRGDHPAESERDQRDWRILLSVLDGAAAGTVVIIEPGADDRTRVDGLVIRNGLSTEGGGIVSTNASPVIANNLITGNVASFAGAGIRCEGGAPSILNNRIVGNRMIATARGGAGIACEGDSAPLIRGNLILGNSLGRLAPQSVGGGIAVTENSLPIIQNNTLVWNDGRVGVSRPEDRVRLLDFAEATFGRLDLLVNNAGVAPEVRADILEATEESFDRLMAINVKGPYFLTQQAARRMIETRRRRAPASAASAPGAKIVIVSSVSAYAASVNRGDYCVTKTALSAEKIASLERTWDTGAPNLRRLGDYRRRPADPFNPWEPVDSSAAAIAAQGLIRLGNYLRSAGQVQAGTRYRQAGLTIAATLFDGPYLSVRPGHQGLILHSAYHRPNGWDFVDRGQKVPNGESSMWGDYRARELVLLILREARGKCYPTFFDYPAWRRVKTPGRLAVCRGWRDRAAGRPGRTRAGPGR